jgi:hypothetical protein
MGRRTGDDKATKAPGVAGNDTLERSYSAATCCTIRSASRVEGTMLDLSHPAVGRSLSQDFARQVIHAIQKLSNDPLDNFRLD